MRFLKSFGIVTCDVRLRETSLWSKFPKDAVKVRSEVRQQG